MVRMQRNGWWLALAGLAWWGLSHRRRYKLAGKVVLITGGSRGLGLVLARELARKGARLAICGRDIDTLDRATEELGKLGAEVIALPCDVSQLDEVDRMIREVRRQYGRIDVLINNAGVIEVGPLGSMTLEDFEEAVGVHLWGPLYTTLAVIPEMRARGDGHIVNISSIGGKLSIPHLLPYSASKFALVGLSEGLTAELAPYGIRVTTVCPGLMRTGSPRNATFKGRHHREYAWFKLSDSLPLLSMSALRAARQVIAAIERGDREAILSLPAKVASRFHGLFPGLTARLLGWVNRLLPEPGGIGTERALGKESDSALSRSWLTALTDRAALRNNEA